MAVVAANLSAPVQENTEDRLIIIRRRLSFRKFKGHAYFALRNAFGTRAALKCVRSFKCVGGYWKLYKKHGERRVRKFVKWQRKTASFWGKGRLARIRWNLYKKVGFKRWWRIYRTRIYRTVPLGYKNRTTWAILMKEARYTAHW